MILSEKKIYQYKKLRSHTTILQLGRQCCLTWPSNYNKDISLSPKVELIIFLLDLFPILFHFFLLFNFLHFLPGTLPLSFIISLWSSIFSLPSLDSRELISFHESYLHCTNNKNDSVQFT